MGTSLDTVIVYTTRMEMLADFYARGLGLGPYQASPNHLGCQVGHVYFGFDQVEGVDGEPPGAITLWFEVTDLEATFARLVALGACVHSPPADRPWGARLAAVTDLDGNLVGLSQRRSDPPSP